MHYKVVVTFAALFFVMVEGSPLLSRSPAPMQLISILAFEEPCVRQGGMCKLVEECDQGNLVQMRGLLCPKQRHLGVECCYL